jgi:hypothetical protein
MAQCSKLTHMKNRYSKLTNYLKTDKYRIYHFRNSNDPYGVDELDMLKRVFIKNHPNTKFRTYIRENGTILKTFAYIKT